jgi:antirestriction protein ArdC
VEHAAGKITRPLRHNGIAYKGINVIMLWSAAMVKGYALRWTPSVGQESG